MKIGTFLSNLFGKLLLGFHLHKLEQPSQITYDLLPCNDVLVQQVHEDQEAR